VKRFAAPLFAAILAVALALPVGFGAVSPVSAAAVPKVVIVVGPAGAATDRYRAEARSAAAVARKYTPDVVEVYSPNATWPAVKDALDGASLVIYMGHGNGWPSQYHDSLFPATENGFGLNPVAGGGDSSHQYFGETAVGSQITLAKNAVVLLNHLCYASGLSEPGLPEGTLDVAQQRVDNYAAGFIKAGAAAVVAEAWASPDYMVRSVLGGGKSIEAAWQSAPSALGNHITFKSVRSKGFVAEMQTETATSGFGRSIVLRSGLARAQVLAGARGSATAAQPAIPAIPADPTLTTIGITLGQPDINGLPTAGKDAQLVVPYQIKDRTKLPKNMQASFRWDPIDTLALMVPVDPATEVTPATDPAAPDPAATDPSGAASPATDPSMTDPGATDTTTTTDPAAVTDLTPAADPAQVADSTPAADPATTADSAAAPATGSKRSLTPRTAPPSFDQPPAEVSLVQPESVGDVVSLVPAKWGKKNLAIVVTQPTTPGRYRLTITLHDADGVAYDAATQALIPTLVVRVTGDFDGAVLAAPTAQVTAGSSVLLPVRVANLGTVSWGLPAIVDLGPVATNDSRPELPATVVARWIPLSADAAVPTDPKAAQGHANLPIGMSPGTTIEASVRLTVPSAPGDYLVLLDVLTPERGSLVAAGWQPTLVRVTVVAP
jgi:hypothetical protein